MKVGLVGFASSGKSTVFSALTGAEAGGGKGTLGKVHVPDSRIDRLTEMWSPRKTTYAEITFEDFPRRRPRTWTPCWRRPRPRALRWVATKPINGRVLQVNFDLKPGLVALNVGADQGVSRGMTFQIYSGSTWKGQVRVENVQASMSSALILDMKQGQTITQGDSAATPVARIG